jgi:hypothetical protein
MKEYLEKYPQEEINIMALAFSLGNEEADIICKEAIKSNKKINIENDLEKLDMVNYSFV